MSYTIREENIKPILQKGRRKLMDDAAVGLLMLGILSVSGFAMIIIGYAIKKRTENKLDRCTRKTEGEVTGFDARGNGLYFPIVRFEHKGTPYKARLIYRAIAVKSSNLYGETEVTGDKFDQTLHVKRNSVMSRNPLESLFPIGSSLEVYYNELNPKENYVHRKPKSLMPMILMLSGVGSILVGLILYVVFTSIG